MLDFLSKFRTLLSILMIISIALLFGDFIPEFLKVYAFTFSNLMRRVLLFLLPFLIFPYMVGGIASMKTKGVYLVAGIMLMVTISNFTSIMIPYFVGYFGIPFLGISKIASIQTSQELQPLFDIGLEPLFKMETAMGVALVLGLYIGLSRLDKFDQIIDRYKNFSHLFFEKIFIPTLPLYVLGTILKITHETDLNKLLPIFGGMILLILATQITYIAFLYFLGAGCNLKKAVQSMKNALPSSVVGFSTMSSVVTMPVTMRAAEQNIDNPTLARVTISTTVNCHDVGECISLPMIALTIFFIANGCLPELATYVPFALLVAVAQFGGVSVPGGSIVIILPFLGEYLGFTPEMSSVIIALSIFLDPVGTANNVLGNGAFAMIIARLYSLFSRASSPFDDPQRIPPFSAPIK